MRIALDASYSVDPNPSGVGVYSEEIMRGLATLYESDEFLHCYRFKQWRLCAPPALPNVRRRLLQRPFPLGRPDLFHALNQRVDWRPAKTVVTTFHDLFVMTADYSKPAFRQRFTAQAKHAAENSDAIIAVSAFTARQVCDLLGVPFSKIRVIPHGMRDLGVESDVAREKIILFVGTLQRRKNIIRLVRAFERLTGDWNLVLAGAPGGYGSVEIMEYIDRSVHRNRIHLAGYLGNAALHHLYARSTIFAFPSLDEGFGIPVLEAMAHGLPVLTSNRSGLLEVAGDAAMLVDPENTDEIAEALVSLTEDESLRATLAKRGLVRADKFRWSNSVTATRKLYRELTGR